MTNETLAELAKQIDDSPILINKNGERQWLGLCKKFDTCGQYVIRTLNVWESRQARGALCMGCRQDGNRQRAKKRHYERKRDEKTKLGAKLSLKKRNERSEIEEMYKQAVISYKEYRQEVKKHTAKYRKLSTERVAQKKRGEIIK